MLSILFILLDAEPIQFGPIALASLSSATFAGSGVYALMNWRMSNTEKKFDKIDGMNDRLIRMEENLKILIGEKQR